MLKTNEIGGETYRNAMAHFAGHAHVVTTDGAAGRRGVTVIAACSVSDEPPTVLVCLNRENRSNDLFADNGVFALNTLGDGHQPLADAFSGLGGLPQPERFKRGEWTTAATGSPVLRDAVAVFDCRIIEAHDVATHRILIGRVEAIRTGDSESALLYHNRAYRKLMPR